MSVKTGNMDNAIIVFINDTKVYPVTRVNVELVRRINDVIDHLREVQRGFFVISHLIEIDDTLCEYTVFARRKKNDCLNIATGLSKSISVFNSLKKKLKVSGIFEKDILKGIILNINRMEQRACNLGNIAFEYLKPTKWSDYANKLQENGVSLCADINEVVSGLKNANLAEICDNREDAIKYYRECALYYKGHMESVIDISLYKPENNEVLLQGLKLLDKSYVEDKKSRLDKKANENEKRMKAASEQFDIFAQKLEYTLKNRNRNHWMSDHDYNTFEKKVIKKMSNRHSLDYKIVLVCRHYNNGKGKVGYLTGNYKLTVDISKLYIFKAEEYINYDLLEELGLDCRTLNLTYSL